MTSAKRPNSHGRFRRPGSSWKPWTCRNYPKVLKGFCLEKGQKQVLFSVLKIRGYKVLYLRMDLSQPMTCLCGNRQIFHISDSPSRINLNLNSSATSSCFFELSWEPEIQKFIYNQLSECIFEAQLRSHPLCFCHPTMPNVLPTHRLGLQVFPTWWSPRQLLAALCPRRKTSTEFSLVGG